MNERPNFTGINEYIAFAIPEVRPILEKIRKTIKQVVPAAKETISYQMPAFQLDRAFIYFAAFKKHIGIYPPITNNGNRTPMRKEI